MSPDPDAPWWQTTVIYQIYPRSFMDANGDGVGDLDGVTERLDYLAHDLGVGAVWLSPFFRSPMADFGYDVADYTDVDPLFGDLAAFDRMMERAHDLGLKVIIDWVPNHSSSDHAWFTESRSSKDNPKRDWYTWRDPAPDGGPPNNWISVFGGPAWTYHEPTGQYYLHSFLAEQPDLNWRNPELKAAMFDTLRFWLDRGVDGFRIDVAHFVMKDPELRNNPLLDEPEHGYKSLGEYDTLVHIHDRGHPDVHPLFRELRAVLDEYDATTGSPRYSVGEIHLTDWDEWAAYYGEHLDELHMPYNFAFIQGEWTASWVRSVVESVEAAVPAGGWPNYVLGNHDEPRITTRFGWDRASLATLLILTLRGTPTIYYGDEIGMLQAAIEPDRQQDPWGRRMPGLGRDGCRTPMQWTAGDGAGFAAPGVKTWLPTVDPDGRRNVEAQGNDPASKLAFHKKILSVRASSRALTSGSYTPVDGLPDDVFGFVRSADGESVAVFLNFGEEPVQLVHGAAAGPVVAGTDPTRDGVAHGSIGLDGLEGVVIRMQ